MFAIQKRPKNQIRKDIIKFMEKTCARVDPNPGKYGCGMIHKNALVLATSHKDAPRATPLEFFHDGLTIYIVAEPGGKIANIKRNRKVSAAIYEQPLDHSKFQKSLQIFGTAELINIRNNPRLYKAKARKFNLNVILETLLKAASKNKKIPDKEKKAMFDKLFGAINIIKITPYHIILREYHRDFLMPKYEWKK